MLSSKEVEKNEATLSSNFEKQLIQQLIKLTSMYWSKWKYPTKSWNRMLLLGTSAVLPVFPEIPIPLQNYGFSKVWGLVLGWWHAIINVFQITIEVFVWKTKENRSLFSSSCCNTWMFSMPSFLAQESISFFCKMLYIFLKLTSEVCIAVCLVSIATQDIYP